MADRRTHPAWFVVPGVGLGLAIFRTDLQASSRIVSGNNLRRIVLRS